MALTQTHVIDEFLASYNTVPGRMCDPEFSYDSGTNDRFLTVEELRVLIAQELG